MNSNPEPRWPESTDEAMEQANRNGKRLRRIMEPHQQHVTAGAKLLDDVWKQGYWAGWNHLLTYRDPVLEEYIASETTRGRVGLIVLRVPADDEPQTQETPE